MNKELQELLKKYTNECKGQLEVNELLANIELMVRTVARDAQDERSALGDKIIDNTYDLSDLQRLADLKGFELTRTVYINRGIGGPTIKTNPLFVPTPFEVGDVLPKVEFYTSVPVDEDALRVYDISKALLKEDF